MSIRSRHKQNGAERQEQGRRPRWPAALLLIAGAALFLWAVVTTVPSLATEDDHTYTSSVQENGGSLVEALDEKALAAGAQVDQALSAERQIDDTTSSTPASSSTTEAPPTKPIANPVRIVIPAIGVDSELIPVGLLANGSMETPPFGLAGWYKLGPVPGAAGPAVIVAHVDSKKGPDVFFKLHELRAGDRVEVQGADGEVAVFIVDSQESVLKTELPTQRIWNQTDQAVLRLITCGGDFNRATGHYLSNIIVYGHLEEDQ